MKKGTLSVLAAMCFTLAFAQETLPPPPEDSPLIDIAKNKSGNKEIDFTEISLDTYPNTVEYDFIRKTPLEKLIDGAQGNWNSVENLPIDIIEIDGEIFSIEGQSNLKSVEEVRVIFGKQSIVTKKITVTEEYSLFHNGLEVAKYTNTYYSFIDDATIVFEVFHKEKELIGGLAEIYDGVSYNIEEFDTPINIELYMSPNPATQSSNSDAYFRLPFPGYVVVSVTNVDGAVNQIVYAGQRLGGENRVHISTSDFKVGNTYTVSVTFANTRYTTNLVMQ